MLCIKREHAAGTDKQYFSDFVPFLCLAGLIKSKIIRSSLWTLRHCVNFDILDLSRTYKLQIIMVFTDNSMCTSNIIIQLFQLRYAIYSW